MPNIPFSKLAIASALTLGLAACGGDSVPGDAVVRVEDNSIKKTDFNHWLKVAAISSQGQLQPATGGKAPAVQIPEPPEFTACIANKKKTAPKKGQFDLHKTDANKNGKFDDDAVDKQGIWVIDAKGNIVKS